MVIYDFGANKGQNLEYFLSKGYKVVAVEANRLLCDNIERKFSVAISENNLKVINCCLSETEDNKIVDFYIHKTNSVLSQFAVPSHDIITEFKKIQVISKKPSTIIKENGFPYYIKIDIEHYDLNVLRELMSSRVLPKYISVEAHHPEVLDLLIKNKHFVSFNAVRGATVHKLYKKFDSHSAGPFGNDIISPWLDKEGISSLFKMIKFGWIDIHASTIEVFPKANIKLQYYMGKVARIKHFIKTKF